MEEVTWEELEKWYNDVINTIKELQELSVEEKIGIPPLSIVLENAEREIGQFIRERVGEPTSLSRRLKFLSNTVYLIAKSYAKNLFIKSKLKEWNKSCVVNMIYDPIESEMEIIIKDVNLKEIDRDKVLCKGLTEKECEEKALSYLQAMYSDCALLIKDAEVVGIGYIGDILANLQTGEMVEISKQVEEFLEELKKKLKPL